MRKSTTGTAKVGGMEATVIFFYLILRSGEDYPMLHPVDLSGK
jgi:hypothetical protein